MVCIPFCFQEVRVTVRSTWSLFTKIKLLFQAAATHPKKGESSCGLYNGGDKVKDSESDAELFTEKETHKSGNDGGNTETGKVVAPVVRPARHAFDIKVHGFYYTRAKNICYLFSGTFIELCWKYRIFRQELSSSRLSLQR